MDRQAYRTLTAGKLVFITLMGLGYLSRPELVKGNYGVSNFWFKRRSRWPYIAGFAANSGLSWLAARRLEEVHSQKRLSRELKAKAFLSGLVLLSSPLLRTKKSRLHYMAGGLMYTAQMLISGDMIRRKPTWKNSGLYAAETAGTAMTLASAVSETQLMFLGQVLAQAGYLGILLGELAAY